MSETKTIRQGWFGALLYRLCWKERVIEPALVEATPRRGMSFLRLLTKPREKRGAA